MQALDSWLHLFYRWASKYKFCLLFVAAGALLIYPGAVNIFDETTFAVIVIVVGVGSIIYGLCEIRIARRE